MLPSALTAASRSHFNCRAAWPQSSRPARHSCRRPTARPRSFVARLAMRGAATVVAHWTALGVVRVSIILLSFIETSIEVPNHAGIPQIVELTPLLGNRRPKRRPGSSRLHEITLPRAHDEHRARRMADHTFRGASYQSVSDGTATVRPNYDQVGAVLAGVLCDLAKGAAALDHKAVLDPACANS